VKALVLDSTWGSSVVNSYDKMGRINNQWRCIPRTGNCSTSSPVYWNVAYTYDLLGDITSLTNYIEKYTYSYNRAGRLTTMTSSIVDANHPGTLLSGVHYNAAGGETSATLGNGINETRIYDGRLRLCSIADGSIYSVAIPSNTPNQCPQGSTNGYAPNGDILLANDSVNGNWSYSYDAFNRLSSATATGQPYTYDYDRFGNRWHQNGSHSLSVSFSGNNNRIDGMSYDAAGNLLSDGVHTYRYDAENRVLDVDNNPDLYAYDADGLRTFHHNNGGWSEPQYDLAGHMIIDIPQGARSEIYAGGRHLGTYTNGTTYFNHADWLGTARARSTVSGSACETVTSLPFGDAQTTTGSCGDPSPMHFTGKERDSESGLDNFGARYDSSQYGRFMTPDNPKFSEKANPQSWNLYSYVENNPVARIDPTGHNWFCVHDAGCTWHPGNTYDGQHSDYTHLLVIQGTGTTTTSGAAEVKITLWGNSDPAKSKPLATGYGFTGANTSSAIYMTTPNGKYEINLNNRGGIGTNRIVPTPQGLQLGAFHNGIQYIGNRVPYGDEFYDPTQDWGTMRANLSTASGQGTHFYLHGKGLYFTEGHSYTAGCICNPAQDALRTIFALDPSGVGEGAKNGRITVSVEDVHK
jgi:RHS repeat-associated protein